MSGSGEHKLRWKYATKFSISILQLDRDGPDSVCVKDILLELRNYRMGLIQTVDQLKFSYMAIVEGAKQLDILPKDALSDLIGPRPPPQIRQSDSSSSDEDEIEDVDDDDDDEMAPPVPPRRSESLLKTNFYNNGLDSFATMPDFLQGMKDIVEFLQIESPLLPEFRMVHMIEIGGAQNCHKAVEFFYNFLLSVSFF